MAVLTTICCISLQVRSGLASNVKAVIPAAIGLEALVPVCFGVHLPCKSVVTTFLSFKALLVDPELN